MNKSSYLQQIQDLLSDDYISTETYQDILSSVFVNYMASDDFKSIEDSEERKLYKEVYERLKSVVKAAKGLQS